MARHLSHRAPSRPCPSRSDARHDEVAGGFILELTHLAGNWLHEPYTPIGSYALAHWAGSFCIQFHASAICDYSP
jgi:hypothetical protein